MIRLLLLVPLKVALIACATTAAIPGAELVGSKVRVELPNGRTEVLHFRQDGSVIAAEAGEQSAGVWGVDEEQICFLWRDEPRECWTYEPLRRGVPVQSRSDRGNRARITLL